MLSRSSSITSNRLASLVGAATIAAPPARPPRRTRRPGARGRAWAAPSPHCRNVSCQGQTIDCWALSTAASWLWLRGDGETWDEWVNLGGTLRAAPECVSRGDEIDCFAAAIAAKGSQLAHISYDGNNWGDLGVLGGSVKQKPACLAGPGQEITLSRASRPTAPACGITYSTERLGNSPRFSPSWPA